MGVVETLTGSFRGGLTYLAVSMAVSATIILMLGLGKRTAKPEAHADPLAEPIAEAVLSGFLAASPTSPGRPGARPGQNSSELTTSPPDMVPMAHQVLGLTVFLTARTEASISSPLTTPEWRLPAVMASES